MDQLGERKKFELKKVVSRVVTDQFAKAMIFRTWKETNLKEVSRMIKNHYPELTNEVNSIMRKGRA